MTTPEASANSSNPWQDHLQQALAAEVTPRRQQSRRLADAMRRVIQAMVVADAPADDFAKAADEVEEIAALLEQFPQRNLYEGFAEAANSGDPHAFFDQSPIVGHSNPLAPPVHLEVEGAVVRGTAVFGKAYEGPPGHVHGGYIAAAFDEVLGMTQSMSGQPGMTGTLTIRYRKPTPLLTVLKMEGEIDRIEGRKIFTVGRMRNPAGEVTAEAEGIFISVNFGEKFGVAMPGPQPAGS